MFNPTRACIALGSLALIAGPVSAQGAPAARSAARPVAVPAPAATAKPVTRVMFTKDIDSSFQRVDANKDGFVTQTEIAAAEARAQATVQAQFTVRRKQAFDRLDANKDGQVSFAEFAAGSPGPKLATNGQQALVQLDTNKDGRVTLVEFRVPAMRRFERIDANRDGTATVEEQRKLAGNR